MTKDRFFKNLSCLNLSNNSDQNKGKLQKLGNLPNVLNYLFRNCYVPRQNLSIDEQMIGTRCRVSFIQIYAKKKRQSLVSKVLAICVAETRYCLQDWWCTRTRSGIQSLFYLLEHYLDKEYFVYFDNFYTTKKLLHVFLSTITTTLPLLSV